MTEILFKDLSFSVIGAAMEVHRLLGPGFLESVYQLALEEELSLRSIPFQHQVELPVSYKGTPVGVYKADPLDGLDDSQLWQRPAPNEWSIGEILDHDYLLFASMYQVVKWIWKWNGWYARLLRKRPYKAEIEDLYRSPKVQNFHIGLVSCGRRVMAHGNRFRLRLSRRGYEPCMRRLVDFMKPGRRTFLETCIFTTHSSAGVILSLH